MEVLRLLVGDYERPIGAIRFRVRECSQFLSANFLPSRQTADKQKAAR